MAEIKTDLIIIGTGPASATAAIYALRANGAIKNAPKSDENQGFRIINISHGSSALNKAAKIENHYGVYPPVSGKELLDIGIKQIKSLGGEIVHDEVISIAFGDNMDYIIKTKNDVYNTKSIIIATGTNRSTPKIDNLKRLEGKGVNYCAVCDAFFYRQKTVCVIGNSDYAKNEAEELIPHAKKVYVLTNGLETKTHFGDNVQVIKEKVTTILGEEKVSGVLLENGEIIETDGVFIAVGTAGSSDFAKKIGAELNGNDIVIDEKAQTNIPGIYAAGDCTGGMLQIAKAIYEGALAGGESIKYLRSLK